MALKRLIPVQDTFIVSSLPDYNFGKDEILELGTVSGGVSRILAKWSTNQIKSCLAKISGNYKAILHLEISEAERLPASVSVIASTLPQLWAEGIGREGDEVVEGANWVHTGLYDAEGHAIEWTVPGGATFTAYDGEFAIQGPILNILDGSGSLVASAEKVADGGGANVWEIENAGQIIRFYGQELVYVPDLTTDIELDVTEAVAGWSTGEDVDNTGLLIRLGNETECVNYEARISFYSKDTHTIYRPYIEIRWDDSEYEPGETTECSSLFGIFSNNLRKEYTTGDIVKVDLAIKDPYEPRVWSTGSIYQTKHVLPSSSYWGIKDEYTNEMVIDFNSESTKISSNASGSFFILDTSNLEPERYYRLLVQVEKDNQQVIVDNKNIFRVGRNGRH